MLVGYKTYKIDDFVKKTPEGEFDLEKSIKLIKEVASAVEFHHGHNLLIDLRHTTPASNFTELLTVATEFVKFFKTFKNKMAFLLPNEPIRLERADFFFKSIEENAFPINYFTDYEEAIEWLSSVKKYPEKNT